MSSSGAHVRARSAAKTTPRSPGSQPLACCLTRSGRWRQLDRAAGNAPSGGLRSGSAPLSDLLRRKHALGMLLQPRASSCQRYSEPILLPSTWPVVARCTRSARRGARTCILPGAPVHLHARLRERSREISRCRPTLQRRSIRRASSTLTGRSPIARPCAARPTHAYQPRGLLPARPRIGRDSRARARFAHGMTLFSVLPGGHAAAVEPDARGHDVDVILGCLTTMYACWCSRDAPGTALPRSH